MLAPEADSLRNDHTLLLDAVREAGEHARNYFEAGVEHWQKTDGTPVSQADLEVDALLRNRLLADRPGYGWLSEETKDDSSRLSRSRVWIVDPIDGTRAFLRGQPHWTICAALVENGRPVLAAVFNPATDEFFEAAEGEGALCNGDSIRVSSRTQLEGCAMLMHQSVVERKDWPTKWPTMKTATRNSMAYRVSLVAAGMFDATLAISAKSEWDLAAADLIVREAGGRVSDHDGTSFAYNQKDIRLPNVLAAGPALYDQLLDRTRQRGKKPNDDRND